MTQNHLDRVKSILRDNDPVGLISTGAPDDEYDHEAIDIANIKISDPKLFGEEVYKVFVRQFDENLAGDKFKYRKIANEILRYSKFTGGAWIGYLSVTWPFATLEVDQNQIVIAAHAPLDLFKTERRFKHDEIDRVEVKRYFPIIASGIRIVAKDNGMVNVFYFWYGSFNFKKLVSAIRECGWLNEIAK